MNCLKLNKRIFSVLLVTIMLLSIAACGGNAETANKTTDSTITTEANPTEKEKVSLTIATAESSMDTGSNKNWPTDVATEIFKQTGVTFGVNGMDDEKFKVLLAGGDLPDLLLLSDSSYLKQLIEGNQIIPLDDLVNSNGPDIIKNASSTIAYDKTFCSNNTEKLFVLSVQTGPSNKAFGVCGDGLGTVIRWDYYKELGYPEIKSDEDLLNVCAEMLKKHPLTETGKKAYAMGFSSEWADGLWHYKINLYNEGYLELPQNAYMFSMTDNRLGFQYTDTNSPLWHTLDMMYKANQKGLLDPDSFTMKVEDYWNKAGEGQYMTGQVEWFFRFNGPQIEKDPNSSIGYISIPREGASVYDNFKSVGGSGQFWAISKNCKYPERAMDLINYFYSADGIRTCLSGAEGKQWDKSSGKAAMKADIIPQLSNGEYLEKAGLTSMFVNFTGVNGSILCDDGQYADLKSTPEMMKLQLNGLSKDFCNHYGVDYPNQIFQKYVKEGKMTDCSNAMVDIPTAMIQEPDDIKRIHASMDQIVIKYIPRLALAKDDTEFSDYQKKMLEDLKEAGSDKAAEWMSKAFDNAKAALSSK